MKENFKKEAKKMSKEQFYALVKAGEELGDELIDKLSVYGNSFDALVIETYAVSKAWGELKAVSLDSGYDPTTFFKMLIPMFMEDARKWLKAIEKKQK